MKSDWNQYNQSLINRGNINFWFSKEAVKNGMPSQKEGSEDLFFFLIIPCYCSICFVVYDFFYNRTGFLHSYYGVFPKEIATWVGYPTCLVDPNSLESKLLKQSYLQTRAQIIKYYDGKDFLTATLALLAKE